MKTQCTEAERHKVKPGIVESSFKLVNITSVKEKYGIGSDRGEGGVAAGR